MREKQPVQLSLFDFRQRQIKSQFKPEFVTELKSHLENSENTPRSFARVKGVQDRVLYRWCKHFPEFRKVFISYERTPSRLYA